MRTTPRRLLATSAAVVALAFATAAHGWLRLADQEPFAVDLVQAIAVDPLGAVIVAGGTGTTDIVKYDADGNAVWDVERAGSIARNGLLAHPSGDLFVGTRTRAARLAGTDGSVVWETVWNLPEVGKAAYIALDPSGDLIGAGTAGSVVKLDPDDGSELWVGDTGFFDVTALAVDPTTGDALVAGCGTDTTGCPIGSLQVNRVARIRASDGALLWQSVDLDGVIRELATTPDGDVVTAGPDVFRLDGASGAVEWSSPGLKGTAVAIDGAGAAYVGGIHTGTPVNVVDFVVTKLAADGTALWQQTIAPGVPFGSSGRVDDLALDGTGGVIAVGTLEEQAALARLDTATGAVVWKRQVTSAHHSPNHLAAIALAGGDLYAGGSIQDAFAVLRTALDGTGIPYCGDGATVAPEECDDGNGTPGDGCENDCTITVCSSGLTITDAELVGSNLYLANPPRMRFKGVLPFAVGPGQAHEPHLDGAQVRVRPLPYGRLLTLDVSATPIPPASAGACLARRDGWQVSARRSTYRNKSGAIDPPACTADSAQGLQQLGFSTKPSTGTTTVQMSVVGRGSRGGPIEVVIGADTTPGGCARVVFTSQQCEVIGRTSAQTSKVRCRN